MSHSQIEAVLVYLRNQDEHHRRQTFNEVYDSFLKRHEIEFDPRFLFEGEFHGEHGRCSRGEEELRSIGQASSSAVARNR